MVLDQRLRATAQGFVPIHQPVEPNSLLFQQLRDPDQASTNRYWRNYPQISSGFTCSQRFCQFFRNFALLSVLASAQAKSPGNYSLITPLNNGYVLTSGQNVCNVQNYVPAIFFFDYEEWGSEMTLLQEKIIEILHSDMQGMNISNLVVENVLTNKISTRGKRNNILHEAVMASRREMFSTASPSGSTARPGNPTPTSTTTTTGPAKKEISPGISGPTFLLLNSLKEAVASIPVSQAISLLQNLKKYTSSLEPLLKRFKINSKFSKMIQSSTKPIMRLGEWFKGSFWRKLRSGIEEWVKTENKKELLVKNKNANESFLLKFASEEKEIDKLNFFQFLHQQLDTTVHAVIKAVQRLQSRNLPTELIELNSVASTFQEMKKEDPTLNITEGQFLSLAGTHSLTYPVSTECSNTRSCPLQIITFIPSVEENNRFEEKLIHTLPTRHQGILLNDWHVLQPTVNKFLYSPSKKLALEKNEEDCIPSSASDICSLCSINDAQRPAGNTCLKTMALEKDPWDICPYVKTRNPKDKAIRLGQGTWAYSDDTPGHIIEKCNSKEVV
ncbi:MAG TPA: hypothetical protein VK133_02970, partial [Amoebophilaceae bacterium]|nr:hypothetical protein [Amoebophilaceae bacterium]